MLHLNFFHYTKNNFNEKFAPFHWINRAKVTWSNLLFQRSINPNFLSDSIGKPNGKGEGTSCFLPWSGGIRLSNGQKYMSCPFHKRWRNVDCKKGSKTLKSGAMKGYGRPRLDIIPSFYHEVGIIRRNETHLLHISRGNARKCPNLADSPRFYF